MRKRGFFGSIRSRMVAIHMGVTLFAMLIVSVIVINILSNSMLAERVDKQLGETERISFEIAPKLAEEDIDAVFAFIKAKSEALGGRILVLDNYATVTVDSASAYNGYFLAYNEVRAVIAGGRDSYYGFHRVETSASSRRIDDMEWVAYYTAPIIDGGVHIGAVLFASSIQDVSDSINEVVARIALVFVVMTAITAIATFILSSFISKPIVTLTGAIRRMSTNDFTSRVPENGKGEIGELSRAFNRMSEQIQDHERVRNEFVSNASHELKTPLATMKLLSESILYEDNPDPAVMKEFFSDINSEVDRLTGIINDLLELVRYDSVTSELKIGSIRLDELAQRVVRRLAPLAAKKGLTQETKLSPVLIEGDESKLEQVMMNLIDNAIKYTDKGKISVIVKQDGANAVFSVKDTGIGISEEAQPRLFERFYRVDKARSRASGGTGLGLSIAQRIVAMHGGYIDVQSAPQKGSTFTITLPVRREERNEE